jgi:hypothetical protein
MAAHPFGGHPTLGDLVEWVKQNKCKSEMKVRTNNAGRAFTSLEIFGPTGGSVAIANPDLNERLAPSQVAHIQRRLAIKLPYASTPEPQAAPEES